MPSIGCALALDGFFFNMFNHPLRDYSGVYHDICQCVPCRTRLASSPAAGLEAP